MNSVPEWSPPSLFYNPVSSYPEGVKLKDVVGSDVLSFLPEHWWEFPPLSPILSYIFAVFYIIGGKHKLYKLSTAYVMKFFCFGHSCVGSFIASGVYTEDIMRIVSLWTIWTYSPYYILYV